MIQQNNNRTCIYKCPYAGENCAGHKQCHILETRNALPGKITVLFQCPIKKKQKISLTIGD